jgi:hypothetical protein
MCVVKTPKVSKSASEEKPVQVFTNRYFVDRGVDAVAARAGRSALRIDRGSVSPSTQPAGIAPSPTIPITVGVQSPVASGPQAPTIRGGGYGGGLYYGSLQVAR